MPVEIPVASKKSKTALDEGVPEGNGHQGKTIRGLELSIQSVAPDKLGSVGGVTAGTVTKKP